MFGHETACVLLCGEESDTGFIRFSTRIADGRGWSACDEDEGEAVTGIGGTKVFCPRWFGTYTVLRTGRR